MNKSYVVIPPLHERRQPEQNTLRRLLATGNLLADHARTQALSPEAADNLAETWGHLLKELRQGEKIGRCETCGSVDHHLVEGLCPSCRPKFAEPALEGEEETHP